MAPQFQGVLLHLFESIGILGVVISNKVQFGSYLEEKVRLAREKMSVVNGVKRYFTSGPAALGYNAQVQLISFIPRYQLDPLDSLQRRAFGIVGDPSLTDGFELLEQWRILNYCLRFIYSFSGSGLRSCLTKRHNRRETPFYHCVTRYWSKLLLLEAILVKHITFSEIFLARSGMNFLLCY